MHAQHAACRYVILEKWIDHDQPGLISSQVYSKSEINSYLNELY